MKALMIFLLFIINEKCFSFKNKLHNYEKQGNIIRSLHMINNIPVENNIPIIIQEPINTNINTENNKINPNPNFIPVIIPDSRIRIITNTTIKINTTNMDPMCTTECIMGCRIQFQKLALQKNCISKICKCQIIETENINETIEVGHINNNKNETQLLLMKDNNKKKFKYNNDIEDIDNSLSLSYNYYLYVLLIFIIYEIYIFYRMFYKGKDIYFNDDVDVIKKDKESRINEYMDLIHDDYELIECLI
jgi:hypothetical protein